MDWMQASIIALIQGVTEFLPISSSAHLLFPSLLFGWPDQGLAFDVAVHLGSLLAVLLYLRTDLQALIVGTWQWLCGRGWNSQAHMALLLVLATIPAVIAGLAFKGWIEVNARALWVVAATTIAFGLLLGWVDWRARCQRQMQQMNWQHALFIGIAQAIALIPGTSRSGITMTAALALGYERQAAARFSFLMSIPVILAASLLMVLDLGHQTQAIVWQPMLLAFFVSAISAWLCILLFMKLISSLGMWPFVVYRLLLGVGLLWLLNS
ncbi:MAG TPA: undecaprenyl-diphosphate phosphatase [Oceanospirillaceae bacterium]|nr:undecaprenyl-diphosphate phosphatase [Oceanospirillaceae bacterium]